MAAAGADGDRFLGALLGLGIGDALGMPVAGWPAERIVERYGRIEDYRRRVFPDGSEIKAGEFTDESEIALCIVESITTNQGAIDPDNIGGRMLFLARGESKRWIGADTLAALERAEASLAFQVPIDEDAPATGDVAARGVPIGLLHAVGPFRPAVLRSDAEVVTRVTHGSPAAIAAVTAVAFGVSLAARGEVPPDRWADETAALVGAGSVVDRLQLAGRLLRGGSTPAEAIARLGVGAAAAEVVATAFVAAAGTARFEDAVFEAVNAGGATDSRGAVAGALAGAARGASGIPQRLIDDLEGRIYLSLAAPWFHRAALRRAGLLIDLRPE